jgi:hypothetical protein
LLATPNCLYTFELIEITSLSLSSSLDYESDALIAYNLIGPINFYVALHLELEVTFASFSIPFLLIILNFYAGEMSISNIFTPDLTSNYLSRLANVSSPK